jgi:hypothetical protein
MARKSRGMRTQQSALKTRYKSNPEGSHRWDIVSKNDALLLSFRYSPLAPSHTKENVVCKMLANRMDVINRNKAEAKTLMRVHTFPLIIEKVKTTKPDVKEIVFPYSEFMIDALEEFCKYSKLAIEKRVHHFTGTPAHRMQGKNETMFLLALQLAPTA